MLYSCKVGWGENRFLSWHKSALTLVLVHITCTASCLCPKSLLAVVQLQQPRAPQKGKRNLGELITPGIGAAMARRDLHPLSACGSSALLSPQSIAPSSPQAGVGVILGDPSDV